MKKLIFFSICFLAIVALWFYVEMETQDFVDSLRSPPQPIAETSSESPSTPLASELETVVLSDASEKDDTETEASVDVGNEKPKANFNWTTDDGTALETEQTDPFTDFITEYQAKERGTWIGDPDEMDPEALHNATYNQLIESFGDIPAVHTVMDYEWKWNNNIEISIEEEIEWLEALMEIFPSESNRKTLAYYRWLYPRGSSPDDIGNITASDIEYLRSIGISVETNFTDDGYEVTISTQ